MRLKERKSPSVNENWTKTENVNEWKRSAQTALKQAKEHERQTAGQYEFVKVSDRPVTFIRKRKTIN